MKFSGEKNVVKASCVRLISAKKASPGWVVVDAPLETVPPFEVPLQGIPVALEGTTIELFPQVAMSASGLYLQLSAKSGLAFDRADGHRLFARESRANITVLSAEMLQVLWDAAYAKKSWVILKGNSDLTASALNFRSSSGRTFAIGGELHYKPQNFDVDSSMTLESAPAPPVKVQDVSMVAVEEKTTGLSGGKLIEANLRNTLRRAVAKGIADKLRADNAGKPFPALPTAIDVPFKLGAKAFALKVGHPELDIVDGDIVVQSSASISLR